MQDLGTAIAQHLPRMRSRASQLCRGRHDADDLVQDAIVRALRCQDQLADRDRLRPWLLSIVTNLFLDRLRRQRVRPRPVSLDALPVEPPPADERDADADAAWRDLDVAEVRAAIDRLPLDVRDTYRMFAIDGADYTAIAAAQGIPKGTVGSRIVRARKKLRELLADRVAATALALAA